MKTRSAALALLLACSLSGAAALAGSGKTKPKKGQEPQATPLNGGAATGTGTGAQPGADKEPPPKDGGIKGFGNARQISQGPVFLITKGTASVVLKGETTPNAIKDVNAARVTVKYMADMYMKRTKAFAKLRLLTATETPLLPTVLAGMPKVNDYLSSSQPDKDGRVALFWYVMEAAVNLKDLGALVQNPTGATEKKILDKLAKEPQLLGELGRIVALDEFVGNGDRFIKRENSPKWVLNNIGNVFFLADKGVTRVELGGLDFYEPNSLFNNYFEPIEKGKERGGDAPWTGLCLKDSNGAMRTKLVDDVLEALNAALKPTGVLLGPKHKDAFKKGFESQMKELPKYFKAFKAKPPPFAALYGVPPGITSRLALLGWKL